MATSFSRVLVRIALLTTAGVAAAAEPATAQTKNSWDPVTMDSPPAETAFPPSSASFKLESGGAKINATFYLAAGAGAHATVLLLHGNPGNERNFDIAQALRRAGYHVLTMNYRGAWGSGGMYSYRHAVEDALAALAFLRSTEGAAKTLVISLRTFRGLLDRYCSNAPQSRARPISVDATTTPFAGPEERTH